MDDKFTQIFADPEFHGLPPEEQLKVVGGIDPDFAGLPASEQVKAFGGLKAKYMKAPTPPPAQNIPANPSSMFDDAHLGKAIGALSSVLDWSGATGKATVDMITGTPGVMKEGLLQQVLGPGYLPGDMDRMIAKADTNKVGNLRPLAKLMMAASHPLASKEDVENAASYVPESVVGYGLRNVDKGADFVAGMSNPLGVLSSFTGGKGLSMAFGVQGVSGAARNYDPKKSFTENLQNPDFLEAFLTAGSGLAGAGEHVLQGKAKPNVQLDASVETPVETFGAKPQGAGDHAVNQLLGPDTIPAFGDEFKQLSNDKPAKPMRPANPPSDVLPAMPYSDLVKFEEQRNMTTHDTNFAPAMQPPRATRNIEWMRQNLVEGTRLPRMSGAEVAHVEAATGLMVDNDGILRRNPLNDPTRMLPSGDPNSPMVELGSSPKPIPLDEIGKPSGETPSGPKSREVAPERAAAPPEGVSPTEAAPTRQKAAKRESGASQPPAAPADLEISTADLEAELKKRQAAKAKPAEQSGGGLTSRESSQGMSPEALKREGTHFIFDEKRNKLTFLGKDTDAGATGLRPGTALVQRLNDGSIRVVDSNGTRAPKGEMEASIKSLIDSKLGEAKKPNAKTPKPAQVSPTEDLEREYRHAAANYLTVRDGYEQLGKEVPAEDFAQFAKVRDKLVKAGVPQERIAALDEQVQNRQKNNNVSTLTKVPTDELMKHINVNELDTKKVAGLIKDIATNGQKEPVVVRKKADGSMEVENGRHRVWAASELEQTHVDAYVHDETTANAGGVSRLMEKQEAASKVVEAEPVPKTSGEQAPANSPESQPKHMVPQEGQEQVQEQKTNLEKSATEIVNEQSKIRAEQIAKEKKGTKLSSGLDVLNIMDWYTEKVGTPLWNKLVDLKNKYLPFKYWLQESRGLPVEYNELKDDKNVAIKVAQTKAAEWGKQLSYGLNQEEQQAVGRFFQNKMSPTERASFLQNPKYAKAILAAQKARAELSGLGAMAVAEGLLNEGTFQANKESYMPRMYRKYEDFANNYGKMLNQLRQSNPERVRGDRFDKRGNVDAETRALLGEILEPAYPVAKGISQLAHDVHTQKFFSDVAKNPEWVKDQPTPGYMRMPDSEGLGPLRGKYVEKGIHRDIESMVRAKGEAEKIWRLFLGEWKFNKVVANPPAWMRNMGTNVFLNSIIAGLHPTRIDLYGKAIKHFADATRGIESPEYAAARDHGLFVNNWASNEIAGLLDAHLSNPNSVTMWDKLGDYLKRYSVAKEVFKSENAPFDAKLNAVRSLMPSQSPVGHAMSKGYQNVEGVFKYAVYLKGLDDGMNVKQAVALAEKTLFDYGKVSPALEIARQSPLGSPFITFTAKAIPRVFESAVKTPWRLGTILLTLHYLNQYNISQHDQKDQQPLQKFVEGKGGFGIPGTPLQYPNALVLPWKDEYGQPQYLDMTYYSPMGDLNNLEPGQGALAKTMYELMANKSLYNDRPLWNKTDTGTEKFGKGADYVGKQLLPALTPGVGYGANRLQAAIQGKPNEWTGQTQGVVEAAGNSLAGVKVNPIDLKREEFKQQMEQKAQIDEIHRLIRLESLKKGLTPEERKANVQKLQDKLADIQKRK